MVALRKQLSVAVGLVVALWGDPAFSATFHVWQESPNPTPPYADWATAAHVMQDAVDAAADGDLVLVTNGVYASGGRVVHGFLTNRVAIDRAITVRSFAGPDKTWIVGAQVPQARFGTNAVRGVYIGSNAVLQGFTVTNGSTIFLDADGEGGGVWSESSGLVENCLLVGNNAWGKGGGAFGGILTNCTMTGNRAFSGAGASQATLYNCTVTENQAVGTTSFGGGASESVLRDCVVLNNMVFCTGNGRGGGTYDCDLYNCLLVGNSVVSQGGSGGGGATYGGTLYNCTITGNWADWRAGGTYEGTLKNCIVYFNTASRWNHPANYVYSAFEHSCTSPMPLGGSGNITDPPAFLNAAAGDYRLAYGSPGIDAGSDFDLGDGAFLSDILTSDLDGNPRLQEGNGDGVVQFDMGAYESPAPDACDHIQVLMLEVDESAIPWNRKKPLLASLLAACASFEQSHEDAGVNQLKAFQKKVRAQVTRADAQLAEQWIDAAQQIIDATSKSEPDLLPDMVWIPPGTFIMGSPATEAGRNEVEMQHQVTISRGFWMGKYEVTQAEYLEVVGINPSYFAGPNLPVEKISWYDATNYCALLTEREQTAGRLPGGYVYRLPTEAEWEYACRAGTTTAFQYGDQLRSGWANFNGQYEYEASDGTIFNPEGIFLGQTSPVGSYEPNAWGLFDMHGNVWEWCQDLYEAYPVVPVTDPSGARTGVIRVNRGGNWDYHGWDCRSACRYRNFPANWYVTVGFRVVLGHPYPLQ